MWNRQGKALDTHVNKIYFVWDWYRRLEVWWDICPENGNAW